MRSTSNRSTNDIQRNNQACDYASSSDDDSQDFTDSDRSSDKPGGKITTTRQFVRASHPFIVESSTSNSSVPVWLSSTDPLTQSRTHTVKPSHQNDWDSDCEVLSSSSLDDSDSSEEIEKNPFSADALSRTRELRISISQGDYKTLVDTLKSNTRIEKLTIDLSSYQAADAATAEKNLMLLSAAIEKNTGIHHIELIGTHYDGSVASLSDALSKNPRLKTIGLSHFHTSQVTVLTDKLACNGTLNTLTLKSVREPDSALATSLLTLARNNPSLSTLEVSDAPLERRAESADQLENGRDLSALLMIPAVTSKLSSFTLDIKSCNLSGNELSRLAQSLQKNRTLRVLQLKFSHDTCVSRAMAAAIASLSDHPTLEYCCLRSDENTDNQTSNSGDDAAIALAHVLPSLPRLQSLTLGFPLSEKGASALAQGFQNSGIRSISLKFPSWGKDIVSVLLTALEGCPSLQALELAVGPAHVTPHLVRMLRDNASLSRLAIAFQESPFETREQYQTLARAIEKNLQLTQYRDAGGFFTAENDTRIGEALTRNLQLMRAPEAAVRLNNMMQIASPPHPFPSVIRDTPREILQHIVESTIIHSESRGDAQIALDAFMLEDRPHDDSSEASSS